jgi:hypothetical protein
VPATEDLLTPVHKGLRSMIYDLGRRVQTNDFGDVDATRRLVVDLETDFEAARSAGCVLCLLHRHADDEESVILGPAARHANSLVTDLIRDHHELARRELALTQMGRELLDLPDARARVEAGVRLNQAANELWGFYLTHMNREERELVPLLQAHFTNEELAAMRTSIIAGMPADRLFSLLGWMMPSLNVTELVALMTSVRAGAPPPFFRAVSELCAARVDPARWATAVARLGA